MESAGVAFLVRFCFRIVLGLSRLRCLVCPTDFAVGIGDVRKAVVFRGWGVEFVGVVDRLGFHIFHGVLQVDVRWGEWWRFLGPRLGWFGSLRLLLGAVIRGAVFLFGCLL